jgi:hypothetical protein
MSYVEHPLIQPARGLSRLPLFLPPSGQHNPAHIQPLPKQNFVNTNHITASGVVEALGMEWKEKSKVSGAEENAKEEDEGGEDENKCTPDRITPCSKRIR